MKALIAIGALILSGAAIYGVATWESEESRVRNEERKQAHEALNLVVADARLKAEEAIWLRDLGLCLRGTHVTSEMVNAFGGDPDEFQLRSNLYDMDRSLICPCLSNGFAQAVGRRTTPTAMTLFLNDAEARQKIFKEVIPIKRSVALSCMDTASPADAQSIPPAIEMKAEAVKEEAQRLHDQAGWFKDLFSCKYDTPKDDETQRTPAQCDCIGAGMEDSFGYKRPFSRNGVLSPTHTLQDTQEAVQKMDAIRETCMSQPLSTPEQ